MLRAAQKTAGKKRMNNLAAVTGNHVRLVPDSLVLFNQLMPAASMGVFGGESSGVGSTPLILQQHAILSATVKQHEAEREAIRKEISYTLAQIRDNQAKIDRLFQRIHQNLAEEHKEEDDRPVSEPTSEPPGKPNPITVQAVIPHQQQQPQQHGQRQQTSLSDEQQQRAPPLPTQNKRKLLPAASSSTNTDEAVIGIKLKRQKRQNSEAAENYMMACHFCRSQKLRCDSETPCKRCVRTGRESTCGRPNPSGWPRSVLRRGPPLKAVKQKSTVASAVVDAN